MPVFLRGVISGVLAVIVIWVVIVAVFEWRIQSIARSRGLVGLGAAAGGPAHLLHMPVILILLTVAFGVGFYLAVR